jgi:hypothetical protein
LDEIEGAETVEIDSERFVAIEYSRRWPKYVASWAVRQRSSGTEFGESDFPVAEGEVEELPREGVSADDLRERLRAAALAQAMQAVQGQAGQAEQGPRRRSLLDRLLGR